METADIFDPAVWRRVPSSVDRHARAGQHDGGTVTGQPLVDLVVLAEELGRELNPGPFVPCNVVADAIARFGTEVRQGAPAADRSGEATCAWCLSGDGSPGPAAVEVRAVPHRRSGWSLEGVARYVHAADDATLLLVTATAPEGAPSNLLVPRPTQPHRARARPGST